jgi:hypothetical protein
VGDVKHPLPVCKIAILDDFSVSYGRPKSDNVCAESNDQKAAMGGFELFHKSGIPVRLGKKNDDTLLGEGRLDVDVIAGLSKTEYGLNDPGPHPRRLGDGPVLHGFVHRRTSDALKLLGLRAKKSDVDRRCHTVALLFSSLIRQISDRRTHGFSHLSKSTKPNNYHR